jgi:SAM-dependent methyltransferase
MISKIKKPLKKFIPYGIGVKLRGYWQRIMGFYYSGSRYECPYCRRKFRKLLPGGEKHAVISEKEIIGSGFRLNAVCPRCYSTDRDRLLFVFLKHKGLFSSVAKVLHVAPEGSLRVYIQKHTDIEYITGDKHTEGYNDYYYERGVTQLDITELPFNNESFDTIICNHVLEHIVDDQKAMRELYRVLKTGGWAVLQVPYSPKLETTFEDKTLLTDSDREKYYGQFDHVRIYGSDYTSRLENAGFRVSIIELGSDKYPELIKYAVNPLEKIFLATK